MRRPRVTVLLMCLTIVCALSLVAWAYGEGMMITVNTTSDVDDFGGLRQVADLPGPDGQVSLREAITAANNTAGPQTIIFNIPTTDPGFDGTVFTIRPEADPLPNITGDGTIIDGATQTASTGDTNPPGPEIVLDGSLVTNGDGNGLHITEAAGCDVNSMVIQNFSLRVGPENCCTSGIGVDGSGSRGSKITNCFIGTDHTGTEAQGNAIGIEINAAESVIQGNLLSGNRHSGIIAWSSTDGIIRANLIGTDITGMSALPNAAFGVAIGGYDNLIGGTTPEARNVISGGNLGVIVPVKGWVA